jgi:membrane protease YdiL (CAAX protease family)
MAALLVGAVLVYYAAGVTWLGHRLTPLARRATARGMPARRHSEIELDSVAKLAVAGVLQAAFCAVLVVAVAGTARTLEADLAPVWFALGALLGAAEAFAASFLGFTAVQAVTSLRGSGEAGGLGAWLTLGRGGWTRVYLHSAERSRLAIAVPLVVLYVGVEEVVFRGVLVGSLVEPAGPVVAVVVSTLAFAAVQRFHMPSWQAAMFPILGALVVGTVHGALFAADPNLTPLVVAHIVFFVVAIS